MSWRFIVALLFAIVVSVFAIQNAEVVSIQFLQMKLDISQALVILLSATVGAICVMLFSVGRWMKHTSKLAQNARTIHKLEGNQMELTQKIAALTQQLEEQKQAQTPIAEEEKASL